MGRWCAGLASLGLILLLGARGGAETGAEKQPAPSLEFLPSTEVVPSPRERARTQPKTLFTDTIGSFGIGRRNFDDPMDVTHNSEGDYYVLDAGNSRIQKFTGKDRYVLEWGTSGAREGEFKNPRAIVNVDLSVPFGFKANDGERKTTDGLVFVVDTGNHRVQVFGDEGDFLRAWGSLGAAPGKFNNPIDIAFDGDGNIFVLDAGNDRIQEFNFDEGFVDEWGRFAGGRRGDFSHLTSIAWFDQSYGFLYLLGHGLEEGTCLIQVLTLQSGRKEVERFWEAAYPYDEVEACEPTRIEIDNTDDYVYILDHVNGVIRRFRADGRYIDSIWGADDLFVEPMGFSVQEHTRKVWIADTGNDAVQRFSLR
jgi:DNA-binding beta-propeller fold protein YncE